MYVKEVTVENQVGLHARPATFFIQKANEFKSSIWVEKEERRVNAKSLLGVLSLGIVGGTTIRIMLTAPMNRLLWMVWSSWSTPASLNNQIFCFCGGDWSPAFVCAAMPRRQKITHHPYSKTMTKQELYKKACMLRCCRGCISSAIKRIPSSILQSKRLRIRVSQYFREGVPHDAKVTQMINHAFAFDVIVCQSEFEALVLEASQIKAHTPKYNILLKDDKGYSYVKITHGPWPRISAALQKDDENADYIGPFTSAFAVREMVETAQNCFLLPRCNKEFPRDIGKGRPA